MDTNSWRFQLHAASRRRMVNRIMVTFKRHLPFSGQEGLDELHKIAVRFEEKIYNAATSLVDYLQKISLKMLITEPRIAMPAAQAQAEVSMVFEKTDSDGWVGLALPIHSQLVCHVRVLQADVERI
ncbi:unnamed protein product [Lactuca saligna]|uniref:Mediator complex subunit 15 KIX domain-containing protein n=1 Tax=Lactuca saligna TaxID=75948 RepID=A0AA36E662_LACSI|nr:unnamed protein product [Lactuca saligna]